MQSERRIRRSEHCPGQVKQEPLPAGLTSDDDFFMATRSTMLRYFGYADDYPHYRIVYPWILRRVWGLLPGARLLDLGAGVNPLPLMLADAGAQVHCVDSSDVVRRLPATRNWSGWGFFDYSSLHANLTSFQCPAEIFRPALRYDAIYSAGMLAHLEATARRTVIANCRDGLHEGAPLLLYLDMIPGSDLIWNYCAGRVVEDPVLHGTKDTLLEELETTGFRICAAEVVREVQGTRTDVLLIHCVRRSIQRQCSAT